MGLSARFHEKVYRFEPANAAFLADRLNTFGPPEGAGGPKGLDADDDGGRGRGTALALEGRTTVGVSSRPYKRNPESRGGNRWVIRTAGLACRS